MESKTETKKTIKHLAKELFDEANNQGINLELIRFRKTGIDFSGGYLLDIEIEARLD